MCHAHKRSATEVTKYGIGIGTDGAPGACAPPPPSFHELLYKLLTTLYVVSNYAPPIKVFLMPLSNLNLFTFFEASIQSLRRNVENVSFN